MPSTPTRSSVPNVTSHPCSSANPAGRRRERLDTEHPAVGVDRGGDVSVEVSVYPAGDRDVSLR